MKMLRCFAKHSDANFQSKLHAVCDQWSAEGLLKLNVDFGILDVCLEKSIFYLIVS